MLLLPERPVIESSKAATKYAETPPWTLKKLMHGSKGRQEYSRASFGAMKQQSNRGLEGGGHAKRQGNILCGTFTKSRDYGSGLLLVG